MTVPEAESTEKVELNEVWSAYHEHMWEVNIRDGGKWQNLPPDEVDALIEYHWANFYDYLRALITTKNMKPIQARAILDNPALRQLIGEEDGTSTSQD